MIPSDNVFALGAVLFGLVWLGFWVDGHPIGRKTPGVVWILVISMLLSNFGGIPLTSPSYDFVGAKLVPLAIPLLLMKADLRKIFRESGAVMGTFLIASAATVLGVLIGFLLLDLGEMGPRVAGVYAGAWIGGAVNMLAVSKTVQMSATEFSVAVSASSVVSVLALACLVTLPSLSAIVRWIGSSQPRDGFKAKPSPQPDGRLTSAASEFKLTHIAGALALGWSICWFADELSKALGLEPYSILIITALAFAIANLFPATLRGLKGDFELGTLFMYLFFAVVGAGTDATIFLTSAPILFFYGLIILCTHLAAVLICAKVLRISLPEAVVASGAALVGPAATAAIASSQGWTRLVMPGILCGVFGYAIATFIGVLITALLS